VSEPRRVRDVFSWLHTWLGVWVGLLLFAIFFTGTLTVFDQEITQWMTPSARVRVPGLSLDRIVERSLRPSAPEGAGRYLIALPNWREPVARAAWNHRGKNHVFPVDPASGERLAAAETDGGAFFFRFHFSLLVPVAGYWIVGAAAMAMLVALVTGLILHVRILKDFFTLRLHARPFRAWLDAHNLASVVALPFHVVMTYTGLVIFYLVYFPAGVDARYGGDRAAYFADAFGQVRRPPAKEKAAPASLDAMLSEVRRQWGDADLRYVIVSNPGDRHSVVDFRKDTGHRVALHADVLSFDGATGALLGASREPSRAHLTQRVLSGLHFIAWRHWGIRWLYFVGGLLGCVMIATGFLVWLAKRRIRRPSAEDVRRTDRIESLLCGGTLGVVAGSACYLAANRLLPAALGSRELWEKAAFFAAWGALLAWGAVTAERRAVWRRQWAVVAALGAAVPLLNAITTAHPLWVSIRDGLWAVAGTDLVAVAASVTASVIAWRLREPVAARSLSLAAVEELS
jgi:uncharacterized iron-regulated membrane protein